MPTVLLVVPEAAPLVKVGGLADVAMSLPVALRELGAGVELAMPLHGPIRSQGRALIDIPDVPPFSMHGQTASFHRLVLEETGTGVWLIGNDAFFDRPHPYHDAHNHGYADSLERWAFFQAATLHLVAWLLKAGERRYDILHVNDHQTGLIPTWLRETPVGGACGQPLTVFTVHNLGYQGIYPELPDAFMDPGTLSTRTGLPGHLFYPTAPLEYWGKLNCMKAAIEDADAVTTVSPTYAREIQHDPELGFGLQGILHRNRVKLHGILNGIDTGYWNPASDPHLAAAGGCNFSIAELAGKHACKAALLSRCGFPPSRAGRPLFGWVSRMVGQKGVELVRRALPHIVAQDARCVFLGSGAEQDLLQEVVDRHPDHARLIHGYDEPMAHLIEAGSDFFLMPSYYEPCGLNQMYSHAYGTLPVVRRTGGLADTVVDIDEHPADGNGFVFRPYDADAFLGAVTRAIRLYTQEPARLERVRQRAMSIDHSWARSARDYLDVYAGLLERNRPTRRF